MLGLKSGWLKRDSSDVKSNISAQMLEAIIILDVSPIFSTEDISATKNKSFASFFHLKRKNNVKTQKLNQHH